MERLTRAAHALGLSWPRGNGRIVLQILACALLLGFRTSPVTAASLTTTSASLGDPRPSQVSSYTFTGSTVTLMAINCVKVIWSTTVGGDIAPSGFDGTGGTVTAGSSSLINSSGTGWSLATSDGTSSSGADNVWEYTNSSGVTPGGASGRTFVLAGVNNSSIADTAYYLRINTYGNTDCTSNPIDSASPSFINTNGSTLSLTVDENLSFTINAVGTGQSCDGTTTTQASTATDIAFGSITAASNGVVCQDLSASTNAGGGYTIFARYTGAPDNSLGHTITPHSGSNTSPTAFSGAGTEAYGYTTDDSSLGTLTADRFTNPSQGWAAMTTTNAELAFESVPASGTYRVGHQVGVSTSTAAGSYTTTVIYTCTPVY